jgi:hypothetical protein
VDLRRQVSSGWFSFLDLALLSSCHHLFHFDLHVRLRVCEPGLCEWSQVGILKPSERISTPEQIARALAKEDEQERQRKAEAERVHQQRLELNRIEAEKKAAAEAAKADEEAAAVASKAAVVVETENAAVTEQPVQSEQLDSQTESTPSQA